jgi:hypothetical protein
MGSFLSFHIKTNDKENLIFLLKELAGGVKEISQTSFPEYLYDDESSFSASEPGMLAITEKNNGWISVYHNTFAKLSHWGEFLSKTFNTVFIQITGQENSDYYYFSLYDKGELQREIETNSMDCEIIIDSGKKFSFEKQPLMIFDDPEHSFDMDTLESYCSHFGLDITLDISSRYLILSKA